MASPPSQLVTWMYLCLRGWSVRGSGMSNVLLIHERGWLRLRVDEQPFQPLSLDRDRYIQKSASRLFSCVVFLGGVRTPIQPCGPHSCTSFD
ncbi:hypothetical protein H4582DRAFT_2010795 [Lactarius indigo]|nr:hypothetical protein H4582DRAFT_2010795 [Lactarius indigo]